MPSLNKHKVGGSLRLFGNTSNGRNDFFQQQQIMRIDCIEQISKKDQKGICAIDLFHTMSGGNVALGRVPLNFPCFEPVPKNPVPRICKFWTLGMDTKNETRLTGWLLVVGWWRISRTKARYTHMCVPMITMDQKKVQVWFGGPTTFTLFFVSEKSFLNSHENTWKTSNPTHGSLEDGYFRKPKMVVVISGSRP